MMPMSAPTHRWLDQTHEGDCLHLLRHFIGCELVRSFIDQQRPH